MRKQLRQPALIERAMPAPTCDTGSVLEDAAVVPVESERQERERKWRAGMNEGWGRKL